MGYYFGSRYRKNFSKKQRREFAQKMAEIRNFCDENDISYSHSMDSYYFTINDIDYRVSNHTMARSNANAYNDLGIQIRPKYHGEYDFENLVCFTASKLRIIEIYNDLKAGYDLDGRGYRK